MDGTSTGKGGAVLAAGLAAAVFIFGAPSASAQNAPVSPLTPALIEAAKKEGAVTVYTGEELETAARMSRAFEAKFPGIKVTMERTGGERIFQRIMQEASSNIDAADFVASANRSHYVEWKRLNMLAPYVTPDLLKWPAEQRDPDGMYASGSGTLTVLGYNTKLVKAEDAPKSFKDLLDPKWKGKIALAHPSYSGSILSAVFALSQMMGWDYFKQLAAQDIMQVQSGTEPPKKVALGERLVMFGSEGTSWTLIDSGEPIAINYASEGTPGVSGAAAIFAKAPHPNAARLWAHFFFSKDGMQIVSDNGYRMFHPDVVLKSNRKKIQELKTVYPDTVAVDKNTEDVKARYAALFGT